MSINWLLLLICIVNFQMVWQHCYYLKLVNIKSEDTPKYGLEVIMHGNNSFSTITRVDEDVTIPVWHILLVQHQRKRKNSAKIEPPRVLYNATYKTCEFWKYVRRIRVFESAAKLLFKDDGNMSLSCPLKVGTYMMNNIRVPPDTGILKFIYSPDTLYSFMGTVYSLKGKKKTRLCYYEINGTIFKKC